MATLTPIIHWLVFETSVVAEQTSLATYLTAIGPGARFDHSIDIAAARGALADRIGHAFAGGYGAALAKLWPKLGPGKLASLCATEKGGGHPRTIETTLSTDANGALRLNGTKTFATLASVVDDLLIIARTGVGADGRNQLKVARIDSHAAGVIITERAAVPVAPEIPHCIVELRDAMVDPADVLPGDGYDDALKPFRTLEDTHVTAALLGHTIARLRQTAGPRDLIERAIVLLIALRTIGEDDPRSPAAHLALAGVFAALRALLTDLDPVTESWDETARARWKRDLPLLSIAEGARARRREVAWGARE
jgi:hypothetical protein